MLLKTLLVLTLFSKITLPTNAEVFAGSNFYIQWANQGQQTVFYVTSSLASGISPNDAWMAIGFNDVKFMVINYIILY